MLVLLTRPWDEAIRNAEKLAAMGYTPVVSPVIEIVPTDTPWPQGVIDAMVATSARAFQSLSLAPEWPPPEARRLIPLFLVGAKTAEAARACGFVGPERVTLDVKALCTVIGDRLKSSTRVLYLAGRDRKPDLETCCAEMGIALEVVETYAAQAATNLSDQALELIAAGVGAVLHFSRRSAEIFLELAANAGLDPAPLIHIAISNDAAAPLTALPKVAAASEPTEEAMLALFQPAQADQGSDSIT
jgi:uroporphyrinogen-III synthase